MRRRASRAPARRFVVQSWILFLDVNGSPHLYLATETKGGDGETVRTYAPCIRAMLRPAEGEPAVLLPGVAAVHTTRVEVRQNEDATYAYTAYSAPTMFANGHTQREAVVALLDHLAMHDAQGREEAAKGASVLAL